MNFIDNFVISGLLQWLTPVHHLKFDSLFAIGEQEPSVGPGGKLVEQVQQPQGLLQWLTPVHNRKSPTLIHPRTSQCSEHFWLVIGPPKDTCFVQPIRDLNTVSQASYC